MHIFFHPDLDSTEIFLSDEEHKHCSLVLRNKIGDDIALIDGKGKKAVGRIKEQNKRKTLVTVLESEYFPPREFRKAIAIAPTKNNSRYEWFLEKATEIGIDSIYPILTNNSERRKINEIRLQKVLLSATKQCKRSYLPILYPISKFAVFLDVYADSYDKVYLGNYDPNNKFLFDLETMQSNIMVIIGPEGDFTNEEIELARGKGIETINLSSSRLRTETAGIVAASYICQNKI